MARVKDDGSVPEEEPEEAPDETESEEEPEEEGDDRTARLEGSGAQAGGGGKEEEDDGIKEDIRWLKETLGTIVAGSQQPKPKPRGGRTVVRVRESAPKEPPPPAPPPRNTKRLTFWNFGLRRARRNP